MLRSILFVTIGVILGTAITQGYLYLLTLDWLALMLEHELYGGLYLEEFVAPFRDFRDLQVNELLERLQEKLSGVPQQKDPH